MSIRRVVVFTGDLRHSVRKGVYELATRFPDREWLVLVHSPRKRLKRLARNQMRNLYRHGWRWIPHQIGDLVRRTRRRLHGEPVAIDGAPGRTIDVAFEQGLHGIRVERVPTLNGEHSAHLIADFEPDLGISLAAPILRERVFALPRLGTINLHKGRVPEYRGMPPAFWELKNGESEVGCTVHRVDSGLDTGAIIIERLVPRRKYSTVGGMQLELDRVGNELICEAFAAMNAGSYEEIAQRQNGRTNSRPTLVEERALHRELAGNSGRGLRALSKNIVLSLYARVARPLPSWVLGLRGSQRIVILLYHRVSDEFRDSVTVGVEQFDKQMAFLRENYSVVSTSEIVYGTVRVSSARPVIAVTFDDGYLDNYEVAAPILEKHGLPATFFISTGFIGENRPFPHDKEKLGLTVPAMNWRQVEDLHRAGFVIGAHTVNHIDCGSSDQETVRAELVESRDVLRERLGLNELLFAYPFGRPRNITPAVVEMVKEFDYAACFSAYGGYQRGLDFDRYDIKRVGISANFSIHAFRAALEGFY